MSANSLRLACMISGSGTTMEAILEATLRGKGLKRIHPALIIASTANAGGIKRAEAFGLQLGRDIVVIDPVSDFKKRQEAFGHAIINACTERGIDIIGQYGWMPKTPSNVIEAFPNCMINQHPGPLDPGRPGFGGKGMFGIRVHFARLFFLRTLYPQGSSEMWTEAVAQRVSTSFDEGPILKRERISVFPSDNPETLQKRLLSYEWQVQVETLRDFAEDRVQEHVFDEPLIHPQELPVLEKAKLLAKMIYPS